MTKPVAGTTPLDASEVLPCALCGKGVMHDGLLMFYEIRIGQCVADLSNIQRMHGLEMMMSGNAALASAFSPDNTVAHRLEPKRVLICQECGISGRQPIAMLLEE